MKINFMMFLIALAFFTVLGILGTDYYVAHEAVNAGLQQCYTGTEYVWQKDCIQ